VARIDEVAPGVVCVRRRDYLSCSYVVARPGGFVIIDSGMDPRGGDALAGLAHLAGRPEDVRAILVTHWHHDHAAGLAALQRRTGAPVYAHARELPFLQGTSARKGLAARFGKHVPVWSVFVLAKGLLVDALDPPVTPDVQVEEGQSIEGFEAIETPGHTPGHMSYFLKEQGIAFVGDALAVVRGKLRYLARPVTPDLVAARRSMAALLRLEAEIFCPGHREPLHTPVAERVRMLEAVEDANQRWPLWG
jgi:glyoxylase-like metal-dependent hydrolase (beta-lactamase superfamily II)